MLGYMSSFYSDDSDDFYYDESDPREKLILSLKREIKVLRNENHYLREQLEFPAKPKGQLQKENDKNFAKMIKEANGKTPTNNTANGSSTANQPERLKQNGAQADEAGLYEMLQEYMVENEALRSENAEMQVVRDKIRQDQQLLYRDNERLMRRIDELERKVNQAGNSWQSMPRQGSHPQEVGRSRDHSPRGSPQYARGGGPPGQPQRLPVSLRNRKIKGYSSPTGSGHKGKQPARGQPMKPPHRLVEPIGQQRPVNEMNGAYMNGHPPPNLPPQMRQAHIGSPNRTSGSPNRVNDLRMDSRRSSQSSSSDAIRDMNEKLKQELYHLEGEIAHHAAINTRTQNTYGSQGSMR